jgi:hypothetical protein
MDKVKVKRGKAKPARTPLTTIFAPLKQIKEDNMSEKVVDALFSDKPSDIVDIARQIISGKARDIVMAKAQLAAANDDAGEEEVKKEGTGEKAE